MRAHAGAPSRTAEGGGGTPKVMARQRIAEVISLAVARAQDTTARPPMWKLPVHDMPHRHLGPTGLGKTMLGIALVIHGGG